MPWKVPAQFANRSGCVSVQAPRAVVVVLTTFTSDRMEGTFTRGELRRTVWL